MIIDSFPPWEVVKKLKGKIDIYIAHIGGGQCVVARSWPRKANVIKGSRYEETINGGKLSMSSYKNQTANMRLIGSKINRTYDDYYLDHFRYGIQGFCIKTQDIAKVITDIKIVYVPFLNLYEVSFFSPYNSVNYFVTQNPKRTYYTTRKVVIKRGVRCKARYRLRKTFSYYDQSITNNNNWTLPYNIFPNSDISIMLNKPTIADKQRAYFGPVSIEKLYEIYKNSGN